MSAPIFQLNDVPVPAEHFQQKHGISRTSIWRWEKLGLRVLHVGGKRFIKPSDWTSFIEQQSTKEQAQPS